jgi:signal transduction histidine kinase
LCTRRTLADGTEVALVHDPAAIADPAAAESAVAVAATAVDNARREGEVRDRIEQLRRLRRGLLEAADEERRALEEELRVGPLREADAIAALLPDKELARELAVIRAELGEIARGLYPAALAHDGLVAALRSAAARSPVPVTVQSRLDETTVPRPIGLAAYYVAIEALANVAKHADAASARLDLGTAAGELLVRVRDDGAGGADPAGGGLSGLRDRVAAVDGELRIHSPAGGGTVVEARLPLP